MRAIITGQIGVDKKPYLEQVAKTAGERGENIDLFHVGNMMYDEAPDVRPGHILDLPISRLASLRRRIQGHHRREFADRGSPLDRGGAATAGDTDSSARSTSIR